MNNQLKNHSARIQELSPQQLRLLANRLSTQSDSLDPQLGRSKSAGHQRLLAYVSGSDLNQEKSQSLRAWLETQIPNYMMPHSIVVVDRIPRTEAGKIDQSTLMAMTIESDLSPSDNIDSSFLEPRNNTEKILTSIWEEVLEMDSVSIHDNFIEVGGDSLLSIRILARARQQGLNITPELFFSHPTVAEQALAAGQVSKVKQEKGLSKGSAPLLPIQHWFFERISFDPHYLNQSLLLSMNGSIEKMALERAIQQIILHHDALRLTYHFKDNVWTQSFTDLAVELPLEIINLSSLALITLPSAIDKLAEKINSELELDKGFLLRFALIQTAPEYPDKLLIVIHHLIVDDESMRIIVEDLSLAYRQSCNGENVVLPQKNSSFKTWALRMQDYVKSEKITGEVDWWTEKIKNINFTLPMDFDFQINKNCVDSIDIVSVALDIDQTQYLLKEIPQRYRSKIDDALITALCKTLNRWTDSTSLLFDVVGHGREALFEDIDLSRTVGWFTTVFPMLLNIETNLDPVQSLLHIKEQLHEITSHGIGYGLLRYLSPKQQIRKVLTDAPRAEVCFNYMGKVDQNYDMFQVEQMHCGPTRSPGGPCAYLLDINAQINNDCLYIDWIYSKAVHTRQNIENLAHWYIEILTELIVFSQTTEVNRYTSSDFPLANLDQQQLDGLSEILDRLDD